MDTYLPAFRALVTKAKVHGVMCAYNCIGRRTLLVATTNSCLTSCVISGSLTDMLPLDCWQWLRLYEYHKTHSSNLDAVTDAVLSGTDLDVVTYTNCWLKVYDADRSRNADIIFLKASV